MARTIAQQLSEAVETATAPFQYALTTRVGCECVAHAVQALTEQHPDATILSIDGEGAFDLISRESTCPSCRCLRATKCVLVAG